MNIQDASYFNYSSDKGICSHDMYRERRICKNIMDVIGQREENIYHPD